MTTDEYLAKAEHHSGNGNHQAGQAWALMAIASALKSFVPTPLEVFNIGITGITGKE